MAEHRPHPLPPAVLAPARLLVHVVYREAQPSGGIQHVVQAPVDLLAVGIGNLDPYRMVANRQFQAPFTVGKAHWRADPYDNQVGELETADQRTGTG